LKFSNGSNSSLKYKIHLLNKNVQNTPEKYAGRQAKKIYNRDLRNVHINEINFLTIQIIINSLISCKLPKEKKFVKSLVLNQRY